jgi:hypothetical protein
MTVVDKELHSKPKIEQYESTDNRKWTGVLRKGR